MKLDAKHLRYLSPEEFRTLLSIELGMRNHELVPTTLIERLADLKHGGTRKCLKLLARKKLIHHEAKVYDGYKLNYLGYDYLALYTFVKRGCCVAVGGQIGVGKESDVFLCMDSENVERVLKLHRLGRISFRTIKNKRDYLKNRKSANWLYLSKLAAMKEYAFMKALYDIGYPVPKPIEHNRHCVVMERVDGFPLYQVREIADPYAIGMECLRLIVKLAEFGLIHGDFNEFNLMVNEEGTVTVIDFPQMVSTDHKNADYYFDRDIECIHSYFEKKHGCFLEYRPKLSEVVKTTDLDVVVSASGFSKEKERELRKLQKEQDLKLSTMEDDGDDEEAEDDAIYENDDNDDNDEKFERKLESGKDEIGTLKQEMEEIFTRDLEGLKTDSTITNTKSIIPPSISQETNIKPKIRIVKKDIISQVQLKEEDKKTKEQVINGASTGAYLNREIQEVTHQETEAVEETHDIAEMVENLSETNEDVDETVNEEMNKENEGSENLSVLQQALQDAKDQAQNMKANELLQQLIRLKVKRAQESKRKREKYTSNSKGNSKKIGRKTKTDRLTTRQLLDDHY